MLPPNTSAGNGPVILPQSSGISPPATHVNTKPIIETAKGFQFSVKKSFTVLTGLLPIMVLGTLAIQYESHPKIMQRIMVEVMVVRLKF